MMPLTPVTRPEQGGCYQLRGGLTALIIEPLLIHGHLFWKGLILDPSPIGNVWYQSGAYSPVPGVIHELDIIREIGY